MIIDFTPSNKQVVKFPSSARIKHSDHHEVNMESFSKHPRKNTEEKEEQADWNNVTTNLKKKR